MNRLGTIIAFSSLISGLAHAQPADLELKTTFYLIAGTGRSGLTATREAAPTFGSGELQQFGVGIGIIPKSQTEVRMTGTVARRYSQIAGSNTANRYNLLILTRDISVGIRRPVVALGRARMSVVGDIGWSWIVSGSIMPAGDRGTKIGSITTKPSEWAILPGVEIGLGKRLPLSLSLHYRYGLSSLDAETGIRSRVFEARLNFAVWTF